MTALPNPRGLLRLTLTDPVAAARLLIGLNLPERALWTGLALAAALQALVFGVSGLLFPNPLPLPGILATPISFFGLVLVTLVLSVFGLYWAGRWMGGTGSLAAVLVLSVWVQMLRVGVQVLALIFSLTVPILTLFLSLAATIAGVYILLNFVNQAHGLNSLVRAFGVMVASFLIVAVGLTILLSVVGVPLQGSMIHV